VVGCSMLQFFLSWWAHAACVEDVVITSQRPHELCVVGAEDVKTTECREARTLASDFLMPTNINISNNRSPDDLNTMSVDEQPEHSVPDWVISLRSDWQSK
jgi:hypothetical protein